MLRQVTQSLRPAPNLNALITALAPIVEEHGFTINQLIQRWAPTTPAQLTVSTNDYDIGDANVLRLSASGAINLTGLARGEQGRFLTLINVGANTITLKHQSVSSAAANRIICIGAVDFALAADVCALLLYDETTARWRQLK